MATGADCPLIFTAKRTTGLPPSDEGADQLTRVFEPSALAVHGAGVVGAEAPAAGVATPTRAIAAAAAADRPAILEGCMRGCSEVLRGMNSLKTSAAARDTSSAAKPFALISPGGLVHLGRLDRPQVVHPDGAGPTGRS